jgi:DNA-directed RNA polymerase subunit beta'
MMKQISDVNKTQQEGKTNQQKINSIWMMAHSGARGSAAQIKQLAGMRGLMAKPSGEIIETPIISNFKEGLTVLEYFNSTHGARKGLADTALKTANSGYLTRRLVDVAQDCMVAEYDCGTNRGIELKPVVDGGEVVVSLGELVLGRVAATDVKDPSDGRLLIAQNTLIDEQLVQLIEQENIQLIKVRSVISCESDKSICAKCYGRDLATGALVSVGEAIGVIAAQSIGEPGTQLTMRTFHIGGAATKNIEVSSIEAPLDGIIKLVNKNLVANSDGILVVMSRNCEVIVVDAHGVEQSRHKLPYGSKLYYDENEEVKIGQKIAEWDPYNIPIITEKTGFVSYNDIVEGVSLKEELDEETGISNRTIVDWKQQGKIVDLKPAIFIKDEHGNKQLLGNGLEAKYFLPVNAVMSADEGVEVHAGDVLARIPRESSKTKDITGGLPRVVELFEARKPKDHAVIAEIDGVIEYGKDYKTKRRIIINPHDENLEPAEFLIPKGKYIVVNEGDIVRKGEVIVDGSPVPHDILRVLGVEALTNYIVNEIQAVYRLQGVKIDNKHIEVVVRQMLKKVEITDPGETTFITGDQVDGEEFNQVNAKAEAKGYVPAKGRRVLLGITKASLQTRSFISAASFQETTKVLTDAAVAGKKDTLSGLKENVIVGRLIPAGTGFVVNKFKKKAYERDYEVTAEQLTTQE